MRPAWLQRPSAALIGLALGLLGAAAAEAASSDKGLEAVREIAIQHNGRLKPFDSFARETLKQVTGRSAIDREDPVETMLDILASPERRQAQPLISIPFRPLREALGMDPKATHISYNDLVASRKLMRMLPPIVQKEQRDEKLTFLENEAMDAFGRFVAFSNLIDQKLALVPAPQGTNGEWQSILQPTGYTEEGRRAIQTAWRNFTGSVRAGQSQASEEAARALSQALQKANPAAYPADWRLRLEVAYNRFEPFRFSRWLYLLAALLLAAGLTKMPRAAALGLALCQAALIVQGGGILVRVILGGRPPVSNFFETMLWLPFVGVVLALIFERVYRLRIPTPKSRPAEAADGRYFTLAASVLAAITLFLAEQVPLDSSLSPVVAVLRSNLWLTVHVLTIVASYGALALAAILAHIYGGIYLTRPDKTATLWALDLFLYRALQVGVVLLAGGIMLGAVWANASWGRYWGWDPKETWALITLLWFLAVFHGRFAGWLQGIGVAISTIGGFFLLLMTYYGVSFYLVGLHSYAGGHAKPLPGLLVGYLIAEALFILIVSAAMILRNKLLRS